MTASTTVVVPRYAGVLAPVTTERRRELRAHLLRTLRTLGARYRDEATPATPLRPEPQGFPGTVAHAACTLCRGYCCRGGGERAYLDERDFARVRRTLPELSASALVHAYLHRVPEKAHAGSCIFHGRHGCTLPRTLRSDVCNSYFCAGLRDFLHAQDASGRVAVTATGHDAKVYRREVARR